MSDTPKTDEAVRNPLIFITYEVVSAEFARAQERRISELEDMLRRCELWISTVRGGEIMKLAVRRALSSNDPNPLDESNPNFRKCLAGHAAYSASFDECPSCKVARER